MAPEKQQFNVYLDAQLVRAVKKTSLDAQQTLSEFVAEALQAHLQGTSARKAAAEAGEVTRGTETAGVVPLPILFVKDMRASLGFFRVLGLRLRARSRNGRWAELEAPNGTGLALHADDGEGARVELSFESLGPLETLLERTAAAGYESSTIIDEGFGRSAIVHGPSGVDVRVDEHDRELFT